MLIVVAEAVQSVSQSCLKIEKSGVRGNKVRNPDL